MIMEETPPSILRRNNSYNRLIQSAIIICSMILLVGISAMQGNNTVEVTEEKAETVELSAGVSRKMLQMLNEPQPEKLAAGVSKQLMQLAQEPLPEVEKMDMETVTSPADTEPEREIIYKTLEDGISRGMDLTETTGLSREDFCELLANFKYDYAGFYEQNAGLIWDLSQKYQVNEIFICGVFALESLYGSNEKHIANHNYGSIMTSKVIIVKDENGEEKEITIQELKPYLTDAEGIEANFKLFANCYLAPEGKYYKGVTLDSIGDTYCPPTPDCPSWADKVYSCMQKFLEE